MAEKRDTTNEILRSLIPTRMPKERVLSEIDNLLVTKPPRLDVDDVDVIVWLGRLQAVLSAWNDLRGIAVRRAVENIRNPMFGENAERELMVTLHEARYEMQMATGQSLNAAINTGQVFDYFDALSKVLETAASDLLVVDPYLDAGFCSDYLVFVKTGVTIRLLGRQYMPRLLPAATHFASQRGGGVQVRSAPAFHDRYVLVDGKACYQSGASFKDGGRLAPTTLTQVIDVFEPVRAKYEEIWSGASVSL